MDAVYSEYPEYREQEQNKAADCKAGEVAAEASEEAHPKLPIGKAKAYAVSWLIRRVGFPAPATFGASRPGKSTYLRKTDTLFNIRISDHAVHHPAQYPDTIAYVTITEPMTHAEVRKACRKAYDLYHHRQKKPALPASPLSLGEA